MEFKGSTDFSTQKDRVLTKFDNDSSNILEKVYSENTDSIYPGVEGFEMLDKAFYKLDKALQTGIQRSINYFSTVNIYIDDLADYNTKTPNIRTLYKLNSSLRTHVNNGSKFYRISSKKAPVLMGLNISLPELYTIVSKNVTYIDGLESVMDRFNDTLDNVLNSKKDTIRIQVDKHEITALDKQVDKINEDLSKVTSSKILSDRIPVNKLVSNYGELITLVSNSIILGNKYMMERLEEIYVRNNDITMKLEVLYKSLKDNKSNMDKHDIKDLVTYINVIAKFITVIAFLYYLYFQLINMEIGIIKIADTTKEDNSVIDSIGLQISKGANMLKNMTTQLLG